MKGLDLDLMDNGTKVKVKIVRDDDDSITVTQDGKNACKLYASIENIKKIMEALAYVIR